MLTAHYDPERWTLVFTDGPPPPPDVFAAGRRVFVCGGLQHPDRMAELLGGRRPSFAPALATGFARVWHEKEGAQVSFMVPAPEDPARPLGGILWLGLGEADVAAIESLELAGDLRRPHEIDVKVGEATLRARTYIEK